MRIAYLCTDLLFVSKIRETARQLGHDAVAARTPDALVEAAPDVAILDLRHPSAVAALRHLRGTPSTASVATLGFCDHERDDLIAAAREAGCDKVVAKGKFSSDLSKLL